MQERSSLARRRGRSCGGSAVLAKTRRNGETTMKAFKTYWLAAAGTALLVAAMLNASALAAREKREKDACPITRGDADDHGKVPFVIPSPGVQTSALEDGSVSFAIPLQNAGSRAVANVNITRIHAP